MAQRHRSAIAVAVSVALLLGLEANPIVGANKPAPALRAPADDTGPGRGGPDYRAKTTTQLAAQAAADQLQVTPVDETGVNGVPAVTLAQNLMAGRGIVSNVQFTGAQHAAGLFIGGSSSVGVRDGVVLTNGDVHNVLAPNQFDGITTDNGLVGDSDLNAIIAPGVTQDATVLQFDLNPTVASLSFDFVFASDEYNEYANSQFNDVFAFFVDGQNKALLPDNQTRVSVNSINGGNPLGTSPQNANFYINNDLSDGGGSLPTEMDGMTTVLTAPVNVTVGTPVHIKLAIADTGDRALDSAVFIAAVGDCGIYNLDSVVGPNDTDAADVTNVTVKYDPRLLVPENAPSFQASAQNIALEIRKRADRAVARYRALGYVTSPNVEIQIKCDIGVSPLNFDEFHFLFINGVIVPDGSDGFTEADNTIKLRASAISKEFKPIVETAFPRDVNGASIGGWDTAQRYWATLVDHEVFHTVQVKRIGDWAASIDAAAEVMQGNRLPMESGAVLAQDLQTDADNLAPQPNNGSEYLDWIFGFFGSNPRLNMQSDQAFYNASAVYQYFGERFGVASASREKQVIDWYMRLIQPFSLTPLDPDAGFGALKEVLAPVDVYDALRDYYLAAYIRRATNVVGQAGPLSIYRFLDEEDLDNANPGAGPTYPVLATQAVDMTAGGSTVITRDRTNPVAKSGPEIYEVSLPANATQVRVSLDSIETGGVGPGNWFPGTSPVHMAFVTSQPNPQTGTVDLGGFTLGPRPDQGALEKTINVAGHAKLGVVLVASDDDAAFQLRFDILTGTAGLTVVSPTTAAPAHVAASSANQAVLVSTTPTVAGVLATGLDRTSFTATVGTTPATVTGVLMTGGRWILVVDPQTQLSAGTYALSVTYAGLTRTTAGAVVVDPAFAPLAGGTPVRANLYVTNEGPAGTPLRIATILSEPRTPTRGANVSASVTDPNGIVRVFPLPDSGANGDTQQDDGVYGNEVWGTDVAGTYTIAVTATGTDSAGAAYNVTSTATTSLTAKVDADGDGIANAAEARFGLNSTIADDRDLDGDGMTLAAELRAGLDPYSWDTDGGGENDVSEIAAGRNPLRRVDDSPTGAAWVNISPIDGSKVTISGRTRDGSGSVQVYRLDTTTRTLVTTLPGSGGSFVDGPLASGTYAYQGFVVGASGAKSAPIDRGPFFVGADITRPSARFSVAGGQWAVSQVAVAASFSELTEPATDMRMAESLSALTTASWIPFAASSIFQIGSQPGTHSVYAQIRDAAGNVSPLMTGAVDLDLTAPTSAAGVLPAYVASRTISVPFTASEVGSYVAEVHLFARTRPTAADPWSAWQLVASGATSPLTYTAAADGLVELYTAAADGAGNLEGAPATADATTIVDTSPPASSVSALPATTSSSSVSIAWVGSDSPAGIGSVEIWSRFRTTSTGTWGAWTLGPTGTVSPISYTFAGGAGFYEFYSIAIDRAGNREMPPAVADATTQVQLGDTTPPSSVAGPIGSTFTTNTVTVPYTASDNASGVASVELWVRSRVNEIRPFTAWTKVATRTSSPFTYTFANGDGMYEFYTVAVDGVGNREAAPATADATTRRDAVNDPPDLDFSVTANRTCSGICTNEWGTNTVSLFGDGLAVDDRSNVTVSWRLYGVKAGGTSRVLIFNFKTIAQTGDEKLEDFVFVDARADAGYLWYDVEVKAAVSGASTSKTVRVKIVLGSPAS